MTTLRTLAASTLLATASVVTAPPVVCQQPVAPATEDRAPSIAAAIDGAIAWIARQAIQVKGSEGAILFPSVGGSNRPATGVYEGSAGVLVFLENAAAILDNDTARSLADQVARGLRHVARTDDQGITWADRQTEGSASLYIGDAGIGGAFLVRSRLRDDNDALAMATQVGDALLARAERFGDGNKQLAWDDQAEIIFGAAGTALFLLELGEATGERRFSDAALAAGRGLVAESQTDDGKPLRRHWRWDLGGNQAYVGFSHGTAGVAYALLRIGISCDDKVCTDAALDGLAWLQNLEKLEEGRLSWPVIPGNEMTMGGWCHGAPGTARPLLLLHSHTGEQEHLDKALAACRYLEHLAGPPSQKIPRAFPPSLCCGVAGVVDFYCDLYRITGQEEHRAFAERAAGYLCEIAIEDADGFKWPSGTNAHGTAATNCHVDLMLGASGKAYALLRVLTLDREADPVVPLPDRRVTVSKPR